LEQAAAGERKHGSGNLRRLDDLLDPDNLAALGLAQVFCFLAFHGRADQPIADYVRAGTLPDDSGPDVLVLFTLDCPAPTPVSVGSGGWLDLETGAHPAYQLVRGLFDGRKVPPLPGLVFFGDLLTEQKAVYVPLDGLADEAAVRARLRMLFLLAGAASQGDEKKTLDRLCVALSRQRLPFHKTMRTSMREWLVRGFYLVQRHAGDLVRAVNLFGKAVRP
jgi:hypothetical protein